MTTQTIEKRPGADAAAEVTRGGRVYRPNVDIFELADQLVLQVDLPGARSDAVDIHFEDRELTIEARLEDRYTDRGAPLLAEYGVGDFRRTFRVSEDVNAAGITAELKDGVLTLRLPKIETAKPRKIAVNAG